ncbi:hypothetical protein [Caminibacter pacificus]|uniref:Lipoprotein n=1 Tax=Caminibacter pacificus TaxID=1424653 RepID=A0AAJ4UYR0_9BACT|nr:hypothetical protein [Caminibacter pacificus]QCI28066.1 hypothetical protein C6V80_03575 [Caminibacter pacificus]ROR41226.1 hypothetical protein EDC58_0713 [Caminibacter pacificus]
MKKFAFLLLPFMVLLTACSIKTAFKQDPLYEKTLRYTQRGQILNSLETKALIDVVYLNPLYQDKFKNPTFLVGVYNNFDNTLNNDEFNLTINGEKPSKISQNIPKFVLYKHFPFYNSWMKYYLVETNTSAPFKIEYDSKHWGDVNFTF